MNVEQLDAAMRSTNPVPDEAELGKRVRSDALLRWIKKRSGIMAEMTPRKDQTTSPDVSTTDQGGASPVMTPPARTGRRRGTLLGAVAFTAALVIGVAGVVIISSDDVDVAGLDAASIIGVTWFTPSNSTTLRLNEDGTYLFASAGGTENDKGEYQTTGDLLIITTADPSPSNTCPGRTGTYRVVFAEPDRFAIHVVEDDCRVRPGFFDGLEYEPAS